MRVTKDTIHLTLGDVNELLEEKEIKVKDIGVFKMHEINEMTPISQEYGLHFYGITKDRLMMLRETGSAQHIYHRLILEQ